MGSKKKKPKGPKGAAAWVAEVEGRGLKSVMADAKNKVRKRTKRTSGTEASRQIKVKSAVSETRSY